MQLNSSRLSSLSRALDVLEFLQDRKQGATPKEVSAHIGLSKSGTFKILTTLMMRGYLRKASDGVYTLGPKLWEVGCAVPETDAAKKAGSKMSELAIKSRASVFLVTLSNFNAVNLHTVMSENTIGVHIDIGSSIPANCTAGGLALLAELNDSELEAIAPASLPTLTQESLKTLDELKSDLGEIRARGYSQNVGGWQSEVIGLGAVVPRRYGRSQLALNIALPRYSVTNDMLPLIARDLMQAAAEISEVVGRVG